MLTHAHERLFADPPLLHAWGREPQWSTGGFSGASLRDQRFLTDFGGQPDIRRKSRPDGSPRPEA